MVNRDCTEPGADGNTLCGIHFAGDCQDYTPAQPSAYACQANADGRYEKCHTNASLGRWGAGSLHREVITVFVSDR
ncbi:MAG: hypothetical protein HC863_03170 [Myxococcales bacterium]|nr:hypothetical protein [Myxococcales bacterium]